MPLKPPALDTRSHQDLVDEALARIPVHTPGWTNHNAADPGVTLIECFAYLTESLLYRANQIPERHRQRFLQLLGVPLAPAAAARGLVSFANEKGEAKTLLLPSGLEVQAGAVSFRTERGLEVLPVEARCYVKRPVADPQGTLRRHVDLLYASLGNETVDARTELTLYETAAFEGRDTLGLSLGDDTVDGCLWLALLARADDLRGAPDPAAVQAALREQLAGCTLSLGVVPQLADAARTLAPGGRQGEASQATLRVQAPRLPAGGLPAEPAPREAEYRSLDTVPRADVLSEPGVLEVQLPGADALALWADLDPLERGTGAFPPALDDAGLEARVLTWLRISCDAALKPRLLWLGINAATVMQREHVAGELLGPGSGEPDQQRTLAQPPVVPGSLRLRVQPAPGADWDEGWTEVDDLLRAGPEVRVADPRLPPGAAAPPPAPAPDKVYTLDAEAGVLRFGDGLRGRRPPPGARLQVSYDHALGAQGNVGRGAIDTSPALPAGFKVSNPVRTWGGSAAESVGEGEKQVARWLQHRDRLVTAADFEAVARRTPGVDIGRVEVLPAFDPALAPDAPGNAPGTVTLMLVPRRDPAHPDWPEPDALFLNAVCRHLDPRRLVTTELLLRGPAYRGLWITVGIDVLALGRSAPEVVRAVRARLLAYLAPWRDTGLSPLDAEYADMARGWPLRKAVSALELMAEASREPGVRLVHAVRLAELDGTERTEIAMSGLQLPRVEGIAVQVGDAPDPRDLVGSVPGGAGGTGGTARRIVPVPVIPESC